MDFEPLAPMSNPIFYAQVEGDACYKPPQTLRLMIQYDDISKSIDNLFAKIQHFTDIHDQKYQNEIVQNLKKLSYRISAYRQIKQDANFALQQLAKLHLYISNYYTVAYLEYAGKLIKELFQAWDTFFFGISVMRHKHNKRLFLFHEIASNATMKYFELLKEVKKKLFFKLVTCVLKSNEEFKSSIKKSRDVFKLDSLRFEHRFVGTDRREIIPVNEKEIADIKGERKSASRGEEGSKDASQKILSKPKQGGKRKREESLNDGNNKMRKIDSQADSEMFYEARLKSKMRVLECRINSQKRRMIMLGLSLPVNNEQCSAAKRGTKRKREESDAVEFNCQALPTAKKCEGKYIPCMQKKIKLGKKCHTIACSKMQTSFDAINNDICSSRFPAENYINLKTSQISTTITEVIKTGYKNEIPKTFKSLHESKF